MPQRQEQAVRKIICHVHMATAGSQDITPAIYRAALMSPSRFRSTLPKQSTFSVIWDSGASMSITHDKRDFVGPLKPPGLQTQLKGIAKGLRIEGHGHVLWAMHDAEGMLRLIKLPAYYVPKSKVRLLSTTSLLQTYHSEKLTGQADRLVLSGSKGDPTKGAVTAKVNPLNNLPTSLAYRYDDLSTAEDALTTIISTVDDSNLNLTEAEKELLRWHYRLGHIGFRKIQHLMRSGVLCLSQSQRQLHKSACQIKNPPKCAACQFGKQKKKASPGKQSSVVRDREGILKKDILLPGQCVSVDHFVCSTKGRLYSSRGKTSDNDMYDGGCIFFDEASKHIHVVHQTHLTSHETLQAKEQYEHMCRDVGIIPQTYRSDNGAAFASSDFAKKLSEYKQIHSFAGVGAHHHNGTAERAIQTIMSIARTMMLHAAIHWPAVSDTRLWPMAVDQAVYLYNHVPDETTGLAPIDLFARIRWPQSKFHDLHVWGCPVYVLDNTIVDGKKLPRWKPRSKRTIYVGHSPKHASTVPLVLNPDTGAIATAFHVVFDDWFATIAVPFDDLPDFSSDKWEKLFGDSRFQYPFDESDLESMIVPEDPGTTADENRRAEHRRLVEAAVEAASPFAPLPVAPLPTSNSPVFAKADADPVPPPSFSPREPASPSLPSEARLPSSPRDQVLPRTPSTPKTQSPPGETSSWRELSPRDVFGPESESTWRELSYPTPSTDTLNWQREKTPAKTPSTVLLSLPQSQ